MAGGVGGAVLLGAFSLRQRHKRRKDFKKFVEALSERVSFNSLKNRIDCNLLAPDSVVYDDAATGTLDNRQSSNNYFIGSVPIDQESRAKHFWQKANEALEEAGFEEWQGEKPSMVALAKTILEDAQKKPYFNYYRMSDLIFSVYQLAGCRKNTIDTVQGIDELLKTIEARQENGVSITGITVNDELHEKILKAAKKNPKKMESAVLEAIKEVDDQYIDNFQGFIRGVRNIVIKAKTQYNEKTLLEVYNYTDESQKLFVRELSRALAEKNIDPLYLDGASLDAMKFIGDIPQMMPTEADYPYHVSTMFEIYNTFYNKFSEVLPEMSDPGLFSSRFIEKIGRDRRDELERRGGLSACSLIGRLRQVAKIRDR